MAEKKSRKGKAASGKAPKRTPTEAELGLVGRSVRFVVRGVWRLVFAFAWRLAAVVFAILGLATAIFYAELPPHEALFDGRVAGSVILLDKDGSVFAWRGDQYGGELRADQVSPHLVHAVVAAEDKRFYRHFGLDPRGLARAMLANLRAGRVVQGGSTLTQQVAKNVFLTAERKLERKIKELPMALALELKYSKEEILSIYLNRVYLGAGTYGFEAASQRYFGKSARALSPAEAAMLAGLLRAPSRYAPTNDLGRAQGRASVIVRLMNEQGYLSDKQTIEALAVPAKLSQAAAARAGGYFADWVMDTAPPFLAEDTTEDVVIATTFDPEVQTAAESAVARVFETKVKKDSVAQAAVVVLSHDGAVRAMVGGRERGVGQFNRATQAKRQTGSAFKPIVYAAALDAGRSPLELVEDAPLTIKNWSPSNYDNSYRGPVTLTEALTQSINTVAVRLSEETGRERVRNLARAMGVTTELAPGPAIALGTSETKLIDMAGVYATIANAGRRATPYAVRNIRLRGDDIALLDRDESRGVPVMTEKSAQLLSYMMTQVVQLGTGRRANIPGWQIAGKTGTTQEARDAWFIGFTADYVTAVWMGNDDNSPLTGVTGGGLPAEIWREVMTAIYAGRVPGPLDLQIPEDEPLLSGLDGAASRVERLLQGVLRGLDVPEGRGRSNPDFKPFTGAER